LILYLIIAVSLALYGLILINIPLFSNVPETGAKYFLLSVISVGLMFGGVKELYLFTGHLNLSVIRNAIFEKIINCLEYQEIFSIKYALSLLLLGFFFKLAAAPNHF
jgi:NADH:ubiquinone oxidoreductase subunit 2 (subunit N)